MCYRVLFQKTQVDDRPTFTNQRLFFWFACYWLGNREISQCVCPVWRCVEEVCNVLHQKKKEDVIDPVFLILLFIATLARKLNCSSQSEGVVGSVLCAAEIVCAHDSENIQTLRAATVDDLGFSEKHACSIIPWPRRASLFYGSFRSPFS